MQKSVCIKKIGFVISMLFLLAGVGMAQMSSHVWPVVTPEVAGIDPSAFAKVEEFVANNLPDIRSLLVLKNGQLVLEKYYKNGTRDSQNEVYSVTKTIISLLIGIALEQKKLISLDQTIEEFLPDMFTLGTNATLKTVTLRQLLTMSSGLEWNEDYSSKDTVASQWMASPDWMKFALNLKSRQAPGVAFEYSSPNVHFLSAILTKATGLSTKDFAQQVLFDPLGIKVATWKTDPQGLCLGPFGLALSPHDLSKLGMLFLQEGQWEGKQVVPQNWIKEATKSHIITNFGSEYGYLWWLKSFNGHHGIIAWGVNGQFIVVVPHYNLVIVTTGKTEFPLTPGFEYMPLFDLIAASICESK